jgi:hypothetical protein
MMRARLFSRVETQKQTTPESKSGVEYVSDNFLNYWMALRIISST